MKTQRLWWLLAGGLSALGGGCASDGLVKSHIIPSYAVTVTGPAALVKPRPKNDPGLGHPPSEFCVFDVHIQVPRSVISRDSRIPVVCANGATDTSPFWPPSGPLKFSWRGEPGGVVQSRELDLVALGAHWQVQGGSLEVYLKKTGVRVLLREPDQTRPVMPNSRVFYGKPAVVIYED